jgi:predicted GNAT family acetyltransferase
MTDRETAQITLTESERRGRYAYLHDDGRESELTYAIRPDGLAWDHTFTPRDLRHEGAAKKLLEHGVADMRARGLQVIPVCPYVSLQFDRHPDWQDVLVEKFRRS